MKRRSLLPERLCNFSLTSLNHLTIKFLMHSAIRNIQFLVSNDILLEYHEIIEQKYSVRTAHEFINLLAELPNVSFINVYYNWNLIDVDKDDNKFVDCGIAAGVDFYCFGRQPF